MKDFEYYHLEKFPNLEIDWEIKEQVVAKTRNVRGFRSDEPVLNLL